MRSIPLQQSYKKKAIADALRFGEGYTEIHDAASTAANNVSDVAYILRNFVSIVEILLGSAVALGFGAKLCGLLAKKSEG